MKNQVSVSIRRAANGFIAQCANDSEPIQRPELVGKNFSEIRKEIDHFLDEALVEDKPAKKE